MDASSYSTHLPLDDFSSCTALLHEAQAWVRAELGAIRNHHRFPSPLDLFRFWSADAERAAIEDVAIRTYQLLLRYSECVEWIATATAQHLRVQQQHGNGGSSAPRLAPADGGMAAGGAASRESPDASLLRWPSGGVALPRRSAPWAAAHAIVGGGGSTTNDSGGTFHFVSVLAGTGGAAEGTAGVRPLPPAITRHARVPPVLGPGVDAASPTGAAPTRGTAASSVSSVELQPISRVRVALNHDGVGAVGADIANTQRTSGSQMGPHRGGASAAAQPSGGALQESTVYSAESWLSELQPPPRRVARVDPASYRVMAVTTRSPTRSQNNALLSTELNAAVSATSPMDGAAASSSHPPAANAPTAATPHGGGIAATDTVPTASGRAEGPLEPPPEFSKPPSSAVSGALVSGLPPHHVVMATEANGGSSMLHVNMQSQSLSVGEFEGLAGSSGNSALVSPPAAAAANLDDDDDKMRIAATSLPEAPARLGNMPSSSGPSSGDGGESGAAPVATSLAAMVGFGAAGLHEERVRDAPAAALPLTASHHTPVAPPPELPRRDPAAAPPSPPTQPFQVGEWLLEQRLAVGPHGTVYVGRHPATGRLCTVKHLPACGNQRMLLLQRLNGRGARGRDATDAATAPTATPLKETPATSGGGQHKDLVNAIAAEAGGERRESAPTAGGTPANDSSVAEAAARGAQNTPPHAHPNLVAVHDIIEVESLTRVVHPTDAARRGVYIISEWSPHGPVGRIRPDGSCDVVPLLKLVRYAADAAEALCYLHGAGKWHGHIKPENCLLSEPDADSSSGAEGARQKPTSTDTATAATSSARLGRPHLRLSDAGVGSMTAETRRTILLEGARKELTTYRPPEEFPMARLVESPTVARTAHMAATAAAAADMWALGFTLYALSEGRVPFHAATFDALQVAVCRDAPPGLPRCDPPPAPPSANPSAHGLPFWDGHHGTARSRSESPPSASASLEDNWRRKVLAPLLRKDPSARMDAPRLRRVLRLVAAAHVGATSASE